LALIVPPSQRFSRPFQGFVRPRSSAPSRRHPNQSRARQQAAPCEHPATLRFTLHEFILRPARRRPLFPPDRSLGLAARSAPKLFISMDASLTAQVCADRGHRLLGNNGACTKKRCETNPKIRPGAIENAVSRKKTNPNEPNTPHAGCHAFAQRRREGTSMLTRGDQYRSPGAPGKRSNTLPRRVPLDEAVAQPPPAGKIGQAPPRAGVPQGCARHPPPLARRAPISGGARSILDYLAPSAGMDNPGYTVFRIRLAPVAAKAPSYDGFRLLQKNRACSRQYFKGTVAARVLHTDVQA
jgi:hypothetical protein